MKIKLGIKSVFKYLYIIAILIVFLLFYYLYGFMKDNVYASINPEEALNLFQTRKLSEDLNIKQFDAVVGKIKQKSNTSVAPLEENFLDDIASSSDDF